MTKSDPAPGHGQPPLSKDPEQLLLTKEAAAVLRMTPRALENWRRQGNGPPYIRISHRCVRYRVGTLIEWIQAHAHRSTSEPGG